MKLKDHVLKEGRNIPIQYMQKRYICRVLRRGTRNFRILAGNYQCTKEFFIDFSSLRYIDRSRKWGVFGHHPRDVIFGDRIWFEFDSFEEIISWLKAKGFKILPSIHKYTKALRRCGIRKPMR